MSQRSPETEEYLEAIYRKKELGQTAKTKELATSLGVSEPSVTEMVKRLAGKGLVAYKPYGGAALTKKGEEIGRKITRKHRLIERFLISIGVKKGVIHEEACELEHAVSDEVEKKLRKIVGKGPSVSLASLRPGERASVISMAAGKKATRRLSEMGLTRGTPVVLSKAAPLRGPLNIIVRDTKLALGRKVAEKIFVEVDE